MVEGGFYTYALPIGRAIAAIVLATMLCIVGGWIMLIFSAMIGFPWSPLTHKNIYFVGVGLGGGLGGYLAWINFTSGARYIITTLAITLVGGVAGAYLGAWYGGLIEPTYFGRSYTIDNHLHFGAAAGGAAVASIIGLILEIRTLGR